MFNFLKQCGKLIKNGLIILAVIGAWLTYCQLQQSNFHKKWQNYNELNLRYSQLYDSMPESVATDSGANFSKLPHKSQRWVRKYFNLYSEEYWLHQNKLMPEAMWTERIQHGVRVNLKKYPVIVKCYYYWKENGAFNHPDDFIFMVDSTIKEISNKSINSGSQ